MKPGATFPHRERRWFRLDRPDSDLDAAIWGATSEANLRFANAPFAGPTREVTTRAGVSIMNVDSMAGRVRVPSSAMYGAADTASSCKR
jgi:hypothetical protein